MRSHVTGALQAIFARDVCGSQRFPQGVFTIASCFHASAW